MWHHNSHTILLRVCYGEVYVTCSIGVHMVGYVMLTVAMCCAVSSYVCGKLQKYTGRSVLIVMGVGANMTMMTVMLNWTPTPDTTFVMFIVGGVWGVADGALNTQLISLFGVLFADKKESAFSCLKMTQAVGATTFFVTAPYLCTYLKIYILMFFSVALLVMYTVLEVGLRRGRPVGRDKVHKKKAVKGPTQV